MYVYRFEHVANGSGPYTQLAHNEGGYPETEIAYTLAARHKSYSHPTPHTEGIGRGLYYGDSKVCGFESINQLNNWFSKADMHDLAEGYYNMVVYEVDKEHVRFGEKQIVFDKSKALMVNTKMIGAI